jgi:sulfonate transport system ATP-binding protein
MTISKAKEEEPVPPATEVMAVRTSGLGKKFDERIILDDIDLTIRPGEFVVLLGHSGSGKSTLLRILSGFDDDYDGTARIARHRSIVFQEPRLLPWLRVLANVALGLKAKDAKSRSQAALAEVGLCGREKSWPVALSGGEAQRVALARALVREPDLLLLDEPFGALDALTRLKMHGLLQELCRVHNPAVLLVTHDVEEAITLADRILVLKDGRFSLDIAVTERRPRSRGHPFFNQLRKKLLEELGVLTPAT